jgi:hypothetical protein
MGFAGDYLFAGLSLSEDTGLTDTRFGQALVVSHTCGNVGSASAGIRPRTDPLPGRPTGSSEAQMPS